jgi:hypothetical protein
LKEIDRKSTITIQKGSKEESGLTITNERGLKKEKGPSIIALRKDRDKPITKVERKERKSLNLKK